MKQLLLICTILLSFEDGYSQDTSKVKSINAYVSSISSLSYKQHIDSGTVELSPGKPFKKTVITLYYTDSVSLYKAVTKVILFPNEAYGMKDTAKSESIIYYEDNKMVKMEESMTDGSKYSPLFSSYYDDKLIYSSLPNKKEGMDRTPIIKQLAQGYLDAFLKMKLK